MTIKCAKSDGDLESSEGTFRGSIQCSPSSKARKDFLEEEHLNADLKDELELDLNTMQTEGQPSMSRKATVLTFRRACDCASLSH